MCLTKNSKILGGGFDKVGAALHPGIRLANTPIRISHGNSHRKHELEYSLCGEAQIELSVATTEQLTSLLSPVGIGQGVVRRLRRNFPRQLASGMLRTVYLLKQPQFGKKIQAALNWTMSLLVRNDIVRIPTITSKTVVANTDTQRHHELSQQELATCGELLIATA